MEKNTGKKERVILIKGDESKWYEQAIFIVNQNTPQENMPVDFVAEAEKIIHNHVKKKYGAYKGNSVGVAYSKPPTTNNIKSANAMLTQAPTAKRKKGAKVKSKKLDYALNTVMALGCFVIAAILLWGLLG